MFWATKRNMPSAKRPTKAKRTGRPLKGDAPTEHVRSIRFTEDDVEMIKAIIANEQERAKERGALMVSRMTWADVLRSLIRQEAERRGLTEAMAQAS